MRKCEQGDKWTEEIKLVWIGGAKCKQRFLYSSLWFVFSCPSARVLNEAAASPSAGSALITVRRSFIWRTFIYSFNFLSFMRFACVTHHSSTPCGMHCKFLIGKHPLSFYCISCLNEKLLVFIRVGFAGICPQRGRFLLGLLFGPERTFFLECCWHIRCCLGHLVVTCLWLRQVETAALTQPVNQSHSLANKDWSQSGPMVAGIQAADLSGMISDRFTASKPAGSKRHEINTRPLPITETA